jgi:hypothetical protein
MSTVAAYFKVAEQVAGGNPSSQKRVFEDDRELDLPGGSMSAFDRGKSLGAETSWCQSQSLSF